jgi:3-isopropylmalate/(R)-2-methylmalate dehydratase small subunit
MKLEPLDVVDAVAFPVPRPNVDTDQVIPARYLQKPRSAKFGDFLFRDLRDRKDGTPDPAFPLNQPAYARARIVVAGANVGCGSSREHAVWALYDYGIRVAIAPSFGDIFRTNAIKNGLLPVTLPEAAVETLLARLRKLPGARIRVDLEHQVVSSEGWQHAFEIDPFAKRCLREGMDELAYTLTLAPKIAQFENDINGKVPGA